jgi:hypothetical protein
LEGKVGSLDILLPFKLPGFHNGLNVDCPQETCAAMCADFNRQTEQFLSVNVPRMHTETRPGEAAPAEPESIVGAQVDFERIADSGTSGGDRIYQYVQEPLRKWLANFDSVVVRLQHQNSGWKSRQTYHMSICV